MTEAGKHLCAEADPLSLEMEEMMLAPLTVEQKESLAAMMETVLAWVSDGYRARTLERFPEAGRRSLAGRRPSLTSC